VGRYPHGAVPVLLLEDDRETAEAVAAGLAASGYQVTLAPDVAAARREIGIQRFDAAILDLMVPGGSGYEVLAHLRESQSGVPVLILTARDALDERVEGLELGADDYLVKPFELVELVARLRAILRRPRSRVEPIRAGGLEMDRLHRRALLEGRILALTPKEFDLLLCLAEHRGEPVTRTQLLEAVWGYRFDPGTNVVDVHVKRLRDKLASLGGHELIRTRRGIGYVLD
jgi:DNA-binding response OmpR family regulator